MAVEIGQLTVSGRFGAAAGAAPQPDLREALAQLRRELIREMQDMLAETERRARER